jgi:hypothetical protein
MRYMFLIYSREMSGERSPEALEALKNGHRAVIEDAQKRGVLLGLAGLKPTATASTVRIQDGKPVTLDGPFAETKEQLAGYYILDCKDLDEALQWAARIPTACKGGDGCIEVRPVADIPKPLL